jgi:predicted dienelactone hydrolase
MKCNTSAYAFVLSVLLLIGLNGYTQTKSERLKQTTITFYDSLRNRKLVTEVWFPPNNSNGPTPLVLFSHGTGGNRLSVQWLCEGLAENGFMVAAVDHFGNTFDNPIPKEFVSFWQRPLDISFVLTRLLHTDSISRKIDTAHMYGAGYSLGGYTQLALAGAQLSWDALLDYFNTPQGSRDVDIPEMPGLIRLLNDPEIKKGFDAAPDLKDPRIKAVFVMAPALGQGFRTKEQTKNITIPVYIVAAKADSIAPVKINAAHYKHLIPQAKWYETPENAGHYVFLNEGNEDMRKNAPIFFNDAPGVNRRDIHTKVVTLALGFYKQQLK